MCKKKSHSRLWLYFTILVFATIFAMFLLITGLWLMLFATGILPDNPLDRHIPIVVSGLVSILLGAVTALFVGRLIIRPIQNISNAFDELSCGNFDVKVPEDEKIAEIREMARHFNAMTYDLSHIETLRSDFVVNVSHEFKTPLAAIEGYATLLQNERLSPERYRHYVEKILDNSQKLSHLSSSILMLSKLENQETVPPYKEYRLDEQLRRSVLNLENKWTEKNIEFDMDLPKQMFYGSEQLLDQVWCNILDNAIKHSPQDSVIHVSIHRSEDRLFVRISDHGEGMSEEVQKHIFEKFYQGDSSRKAEGNGLGLALVKRIIDLCRGEIMVQSTPGRGTTFQIALPPE